VRITPGPLKVWLSRRPPGAPGFNHRTPRIRHRPAVLSRGSELRRIERGRALHNIPIHRRPRCVSQCRQPDSFHKIQPTRLEAQRELHPRRIAEVQSEASRACGLGVLDTGFDWMLAPLVWLVLLSGMLLSLEAGMRLRARYLRAAPSDSTAQRRPPSGVRSDGTLNAVPFRGPPFASTIVALSRRNRGRASQSVAAADRSTANSQIWKMAMEATSSSAWNVGGWRRRASSLRQVRWTLCHRIRIR